MGIIQTITFLCVIVQMIIIIYGKIKKYGINAFIVFLISYTGFYALIPLIMRLFPEKMNTSTQYNQMLLRASEEKIFFTTVLIYGIFIMMVLLYEFIYKNKETDRILDNTGKLNEETEKRLLCVANIFFIIGLLAVFIVMIKLGGIKRYLAFGTYTRGHVSEAGRYLSSKYMPLISVAIVTLIPPYLYYCLMKNSATKKNKFLFWASFILAILYLFHNQGRAPLILFLIPFVWDQKKEKKISLTSICVLFLGIFPLLNVLSGVFNFFSYGVYRSGTLEFIETFTREFSYPYANFISKKELIGQVGYRYCIDYVVWFKNMFPEALLKIIGFTKKGFSTIGYENTEAYGKLLFEQTRGGIPADILTFNYYQLGFLSLVVSMMVIVCLIAYLDRKIEKIMKISAVRIIVFRVVFMVPILMTNSDLSVIFRTRIDWIIMVVFILFIYKSEFDRNYDWRQNEYKKSY